MYPIDFYQLDFPSFQHGCDQVQRKNGGENGRGAQMVHHHPEERSHYGETDVAVASGELWINHCVTVVLIMAPIGP